MKIAPLAIAATGLASLVAFGGCASQQYVYTPETTNAVAAGSPAERTAIPQERPQGTVEVASFGITDLELRGTRVPALHVRMIVTNDGDDTPWTLDTNQQLLQIPNDGRAAPIYVNSDVRTLPNVTVARQARHVLDLYYQLPDGITTDAQLPAFSLLWQVTTPSRQVASRTTFDRVDRAPRVAYGTAYDAWPLWAGYGPYWWYNPYYPEHVFLNTRPIVVGRDVDDRVEVGHFGGHYRPSHDHARR